LLDHHDRRTNPGFRHGSENQEESCKQSQIILQSFFINASFALDIFGLLSFVESDTVATSPVVLR